MRNGNNIQWKRLSVEAAAIVASILLAFTIDAWWDDKKEREDERAILSSLLAEFEQVRKNVDDILKFQVAILESAQRLLQLSVDENPTIGSIELDRLLVDQRWGSSPDRFSAPELNSVISRGDLRLISNRVLREDLRTWPAKLIGVSKVLAEDFQFTSMVVDPYFRDNLSLLQLHAAMTHRPGDPTYIPETPDVKPKDSVSHIPILADPFFQNIMAQRHDLLNEIINLAREPELPQQLDETIAFLRRELER
jgi:hypothetical protein